MRFLIGFLALIISSELFASRGYLGQNPVNEVRTAQSSGWCGPANGACLLIFFEGGAVGCSDDSDYLAIRFTNPEIESMQAMAYISLTTKKKMRIYGTKESCKDADTLSPNGVSIYDTAH